MADNIDITPGSGKAVASEDISSVFYQRIKLIDPTLLSTAPIGVAANPLKVSLANTGANATAVKVDGSAVTQPVSGPLTDIQLRASAVPVDATGSTVITGGLTDTQLRATAVPVSGPLTDTQLRATAVPISGTVTANLGTIGAAATAANQATEIASLASIKTNSDTLVASGAGGFVRQDSTATIAKESGGNLASLVAGTHLEDDPSANADRGYGALAVRQDTPANTGADGDYEFLKQSAGRLWASAKIDTALPAGTNVIGQINPQPTTAGGCLVALMGSADGSTALTNTAQAIKASAGQLYGWYIYNPNATAIFVSIYNVAAASVVIGTTNPQMSLCIPPTSAANILGAVGIEFTNAGFSASATTTGGGSTAPGIALEAQFFFK